MDYQNDHLFEKIEIMYNVLAVNFEQNISKWKSDEFFLRKIRKDTNHNWNNELRVCFHENRMCKIEGFVSIYLRENFLTDYLKEKNQSQVTIAMIQSVILRHIYSIDNFPYKNYNSVIDSYYCSKLLEVVLIAH